MRSYFFFNLLALSLIALGYGCGGEDEGSSCDESTKGFISCGAFNECQPGQYCADETFGTCDNGCLSDVNCGCNQVCQKSPGSDTGTCSLQSSGPVCGDGTCAQGENCPADCGSTGPVCGDGTCAQGENCPVDCGSTGPVCGDGTCAQGEDCPADCANLEALACKDNCSGYDFFGCFNPGDLQDCWDACEAATSAQLQQFVNCSGTATVTCDTSCLDYLP